MFTPRGQSGWIFAAQILVSTVIPITLSGRTSLYPTRFESHGKLNMRAWIVALSVLGLVVTATAAKADRRVALVIGNGAYKNMQSLANPPADAEAMAKLLKSIDFEVIEGGPCRKPNRADI
jgi:Caspase domain